MTWNPMEMEYDDTVCAVCGAKLPENPEVGTPDFDGYCSNECAEKDAGSDTMLPLYEEEPKTRLVYVRWECDEEETPVLVTASEYEVLRELVGEGEPEAGERECVCGCGKIRRSAAEEVK